jgi:cardiolipin synthase
LHRKLCAVDGRIAFCGGINVLDDHYDPNYGALDAPRFDFAVRITGPLVMEVTDTMARFWWRLQAVRGVRERELPSAWAALQAAIQAAPDTPTEPPDPGAAGIRRGARAALLLRDNLRHRRHIERAYRKAIGSARSEIIIANAYFLPGVRLHRALLHAARRGVKVKILLQGRYEYFMQFHAARRLYGALLGAGAEVHEYAPSFLHAKVAVIDGHWATVGSSNLDPLSLLLAREANVVVEDVAFAQELRARLEQAMQHDGHQVDSASYRDRPRRQRILDTLAFALMRVMLFLSRNSY